MRRNPLRSLLAVSLLLGFSLSCPPVRAEDPVSLLPVFGSEGYMINKKTKNNHSITGWLPKKWLDNSSWAQVNAVYTALLDPPKADLTAVRIDASAVDEGQLQMTTFDGHTDYQQGTTYAITGWVRSASGSTVKVGIRNVGPTHEFFKQDDVKGTAEWKPFEVVFTPELSCQGFVMFVMRQPGVVDVAGISLVQR